METAAEYIGYLPVDHFFLIFAANGARRNPIGTSTSGSIPGTRIEVGAETIDVAAEEVNGEERERVPRARNRGIPEPRRSVIVLAPEGDRRGVGRIAVEPP